MRIILWLTGALLLFLAGCAPKAAQKHEAVFFPADPNPPRVQFLMGIGDSQDVEGRQVEYSIFSMDAQRAEEVKYLVKPYGIAVDGGKIYVSDTMSGKVAVIDLAQKKFDWLKGDFGPGKLKKPVNMTTDKGGNLYVADTVRKKVLVYDSEGNFKKAYGEAYEMKPVDVEVDENRLYVLDMSRSKILAFDKETGALIEGFGQESKDPLDNLALPTNMDLTERGIFYVSNITTGRIVKLDRDGHVLGSFGQMGDGFGQFGRPKGVATDSDERSYVVDSAHQNVQVFNESGRLLLFFGNPGLPVGSMNIPASVAVTKQDLEIYQAMAEPGFDLEQIVLVTNQAGPHKVGIYGLGKKRGFDYEKYYQETMEIWKKRAESLADKETKK